MHPAHASHSPVGLVPAPSIRSAVPFPIEGGSTVTEVVHQFGGSARVVVRDSRGWEALATFPVETLTNWAVAHRLRLAA